MTVKELIEKLQQMPQYATVLNGGDLFMEFDTVEKGNEGDVILY